MTNNRKIRILVDWLIMFEKCSEEERLRFIKEYEESTLKGDKEFAKFIKAYNNFDLDKQAEIKEKLLNDETIDLRNNSNNNSYNSKK